MKSIQVDRSWDGRRLTRFLQKALPAASMGQIARFLRLGRVKVDGKRGREDTVLAKGQPWFDVADRTISWTLRLREEIPVSPAAGPGTHAAAVSLTQAIYDRLWP